MLFPYKRPRHAMRAMHGFVVYIFAKVWCRAPNEEYSLELFKGLPALYIIMDELHRSDLAGVDNGAGAFFYSHVNQIFKEFKTLSSKDIESYKIKFKCNNAIQSLCEGKKEPSRYDAGIHDGLMSTVKAFFSKLYSCGFFDLAIVKKHIGADLQDHYKAFTALNKIPCCPFCGLLPMDSEFDPTREAYDHYLPASKYPFNSVNMRNLAPACYKCNSQNKGAKDPLQDEAGVKRKAFYPYADETYPIRVTVQFNARGQLPATAQDISISLSCVGHDEEVITWDKLYKIRERYEAKCLSANGAKHWLGRILVEKDNYHQISQDMLDKEQELLKKFPWHDSAFLKTAVLDEAVRIGLMQDPLIANIE